MEQDGVSPEDNTMIEETHLLCDRIQKMIEDAAAIMESDSLTEKHKQLQQIASTIESLEKIGVAVPQELATLSEGLTQEVANRDVAAQALKTLYERLEVLTDKIEPYIRHGRSPVRRSDLPELTREEEYYPVIIGVLREMGGSGPVRGALEAVYSSMKDRFLPGDLEMYPGKNIENWRRTARIARWRLMKKGVLRSDSPHQTWELADPDGSKPGGTQ